MRPRFLLLLLLSGCAGAHSPRAPLASEVVGCYWGRGGFSLIELKISENGRYVADYYFDIGHAGYSLGTWSLQRGKIMLNPRHADSVLADLKGAFEVIREDSKVSLVIPGAEEAKLASFSPLQSRTCEL